MKEKEIILNAYTDDSRAKNSSDTQIQFHSLANEDTPREPSPYAFLDKPSTPIDTETALRRRRGAAPTRRSRTRKRSTSLNLRSRQQKEDNQEKAATAGRKSKGGKALKATGMVVGAILAIIITIVLVAGAWYLFNKNDSLGGKPVDQAALAAQDAVVDGKVSVLLVGTDRVASNTDTIILVTFDTEQKKVNMISIPRDTRVPYGNTYVKINSIYNAKGMAGLITQVKSLTGIPINYYAMIDTQSFRKVVDVLGGVDFYVPYNMEYHDPDQNLHISLSKGQQHLNGEQAEQLVRFRSYGEADLSRGDVQRDFIKAMIEQHATLSNLPKFGELFNTIVPNLETSITYGDAVKYATALAGTPSDSILSHRLPGAAMYVGEISYYIADADDAEEFAISIGYTGEGIKRIPLPSNASTTPPETIPEDEILTEEDEERSDEDEEDEEDEDNRKNDDEDEKTTSSGKDNNKNKDKDTEKDKNNKNNSSTKKPDKDDDDSGKATEEYPDGI